MLFGSFAIEQQSFMQVKAHNHDVKAPILTAPWFYRACRWFQKYDIFVGFYAERYLRQLGLLDYVVRYKIGASTPFDVPIQIRGYDQLFLDRYESDVVSLIASRIERLGSNVTLIDCGADIGLMSCKLVVHCPKIKRLIAFEPNSRAIPYLQSNLTHLSIEASIHEAAVSDFHGSGQLVKPSFDRTDHAAFLERCENGPIAVTTVDEIIPKGEPALVMKIDVEGEELPVIRGAKETLTSCARFLLIYEAHPKQSSRVGRDPMEAFRWIQTLRDCRGFIAEAPNHTIDPSKSMWEQVAPTRVYNICVEG